MEQNVHKKFNDRQNEVRLFIIEFTVNNKRAFHVERDKSDVLKALSMTEEEYREIIEVLKARDGMVTDEEGHVNFLYPVSALETNHQVTLADGRNFSAMCAIDAIGAAFTFHQDIEVHSVSAVSGEPIFVKIVNGEAAEYSPKTLHALTFPLGQLSDWAGSC